MPMLTYASATGHAFVNRRLYPPESWANDPRRRKEAGVRADLLFATKPALVIDMLGEEISAGTPFRYLCGGCGYGRDPGLRTSSGKVERGSGRLNNGMAIRSVSAVGSASQTRPDRK